MNTANVSYIGIITLVLVALITLVHKTTKTRFELRTMIIVSLLSLLSMVLAAYLSVVVPLFGFPSLKFGFSQLPIMMAGAMFGPWWGMVAGVLEDLLELASGTISSPFIGFTLNKALIGIIPGLVFLYAQKRSVRPILNVTIGILYSWAFLFILTTPSVTVSQTTYVLDPLTKAILIGLVILTQVLAWLMIRALKQKTQKQKTFETWLLAVLLIEVIVNVLLTPLWLQLMYGIPFMIQVMIRSIKASFFVIINTFLAYTIHQSLKRLKTK